MRCAIVRCVTYTGAAEIVVQIVETRTRDGNAHALAMQPTRNSIPLCVLPERRDAEKRDTCAVAGLLGDEGVHGLYACGSGAIAVRCAPLQKTATPL